MTTTKSHPHSRRHASSQRAGAVSRPRPRCAESGDRLPRQHPLFGNLRLRPRPPERIFSETTAAMPGVSLIYLGDGLQGRSRAEGRHGDVVRPRPEPRGLSRGPWLLSRSWRCGRRRLAACRGDASRRRCCCLRSPALPWSHRQARNWPRRSIAPLPSPNSRRCATPGGGGREGRARRRRALCRRLSASRRRCSVSPRPNR